MRFYVSELEVENITIAALVKDFNLLTRSFNLTNWRVRNQVISILTNSTESLLFSGFV